MHGFFDPDWMFAGGGMVIGLLWLAMIWLVPVLLLVALLKYVFGKPRSAATATHPPAQAPNAALEILKAAYARGDIARDEFLQKRNDLLEK